MPQMCPFMMWLFFMMIMVFVADGLPMVIHYFISLSSEVKAAKAEKE